MIRCFLLILILISTANSEELEIKKVLSSVLTSHPLLSATTEEMYQAEAELLASEGAFDRFFKVDAGNYVESYYQRTIIDSVVEQPLKFNGSKLFAGYRVSEGDIPVYDEQYHTTTGGEFRAGVELPLLRDAEIDKRRASISRAEIQQKIANTSVKIRKNDLLRAATIAYWNWSASEQRYGVLKNLLSVAEERQRQLMERVKKGDIPQFDVDDNQRQILQRKAQVLQAEQALRNAKVDLGLFYRDANGQPFIIKDQYHPNKLSEKHSGNLLQISSAEVLARRPDLERISHQVDQFEVEKKLSENQVLPKLDLQLMGAQDAGSGEEAYEQGELKVGVKLEVPLQIRTATGRKEVAESKIRELNKTQEFSRQNLENNLEIAKNNLKFAKERFTYTKNEADTARQLEVGERTRFEQGDSNLIFVNLREQTAAEAAIRLIDSKLDIQRAFADLRAITLEWKDLAPEAKFD